MNFKPGKPILIVLATAALLGLPSVALASSRDVIRDCSEDGVLDGHYSQGELQGALNNLPSDLDEYTDCRSVIRSAALNKAGGKGGSNPKAAVSKVNTSAPPTVAEQARVAKAAKGGEAVKVGAETIKPGGAGFLASAFDNDVPTLLVALLALFGAALIGGTALSVSHRWPALGGTVAKPFKAAGRGVRSGFSRFRR